MEASLLPSRAIRALSKRVVLVAVRRADAASAPLREEFGIPYLNSWVVVLDGKGETLASWVGDAAGAGCRESSVAKFPSQLAKAIRHCLERSESVQELERRWRKRPASMATFERFADRLKEMDAFARLREICEEAAANEAFSEQRRDELTVRAFLARTWDAEERLSTQKGRDRFIRDGERLLVAMAGHPKATDLVGALFAGGYGHGFDVPARSAQAIARLRRRARNLEDPAKLEARIAELARQREQWIEQMQEIRERADDGIAKQHCAAILGDARAAIELYSKGPLSKSAQAPEWVRDAKEKLRRERSRGSRARHQRVRIVEERRGEKGSAEGSAAL